MQSLLPQPKLELAAPVSRRILLGFSGPLTKGIW